MLQDYDFDAAFDASPGKGAYFEVIQSIGGVDPKWVVDKLAPYFARDGS